MDKLETLGIILSLCSGMGGAVMAVLSYRLARLEMNSSPNEANQASEHTLVLDGRTIDLLRLGPVERAELISRLERAV